MNDALQSIQYTRQRAFSRYTFKCDICGEVRIIQISHATYAMSSFQTEQKKKILIAIFPP
jgi:hypothetical protein